MIETNFHVPITATCSAAASTLAILIYLLVIVNIYAESELQQNEESDCYSELLYLEAVTYRVNVDGTTLVLNMSKYAKDKFQSCMNSISVNNMPSISEAIDNWRGVSAVIMAIPAGE